MAPSFLSTKESRLLRCWSSRYPVCNELFLNDAPCLILPLTLLLNFVPAAPLPSGKTRLKQCCNEKEHPCHVHPLSQEANDRALRQGSFSSSMPPLQSPKTPLVHRTELPTPLTQAPALRDGVRTPSNLRDTREQDFSGCAPMQEADSNAEPLPGLRTPDAREGINGEVYPENLYPLRPGPDAPFSPKVSIARSACEYGRLLLDLEEQVLYRIFED